MIAAGEESLAHFDGLLDGVAQGRGWQGQRVGDAVNSQVPPGVDPAAEPIVQLSANGAPRLLDVGAVG